MEELTKAQKRHYRDLIGMAYERELSAELDKLHAEFARWKAGEFDAFELENRIHKFHQGPARELWKSYTYPSNMTDIVLARCVYDKAVAFHEIKPEYQADIVKRLHAFHIVRGDKTEFKIPGQGNQESAGEKKGGMEGRKRSEPEAAT